ncbi:DNA polymerase III subunit delta [Rhodoligotrophos defluvii]|uniref:DNA polymerase III subunit delta n=1 Tax=Rhodoligotrophos defluvii TaxID=2561934 RepID=UPI0010C939BB|nr:DNA polymerase III subunit delta [Rhodoligotrophos defluvii]
MVELKGARATGFVQRPGTEFNVVLVHGSDEGLVRERCQMLVRAIAGAVDDPFTVARLDEEILAADPARLADEALAISLLGTRRVVWVRGAGAHTAKAVANFLPHAKGDTLVVIEAGNLKKSDKLRQAVEQAPNAAAIACYADSDADIRGLIEETLRIEGLTISPEALEAFSALLGSDRQLSRNEIEKLCLYAKGRGRIELADIAQISGDASHLAVDDLMDCVFGGDMVGADHHLARLLDAGTQPAALIISAANHLALLRRLCVQMRSGSQAANVVAGARPPIFFKRQAAIARQLTLWPLEALLGAGATIADCERRTRQMAGLDHELVGRLLLTLARSAQARRASAA